MSYQIKVQLLSKEVLPTVTLLPLCEGTVCFEDWQDKSISMIMVDFLPQEKMIPIDTIKDVPTDIPVKLKVYKSQLRLIPVIPPIEKNEVGRDEIEEEMVLLELNQVREEWIRLAQIEKIGVSPGGAVLLEMKLSPVKMKVLEYIDSLIKERKDAIS